MSECVHVDSRGAITPRTRPGDGQINKLYLSTEAAIKKTEYYDLVFGDGDFVNKKSLANKHLVPNSLHYICLKLF